MMTLPAIPPEVVSVLEDFCQTKRSGSVVLEIKEGQVQQIKTTTTTAVAGVDKSKPMT